MTGREYSVAELVDDIHEIKGLLQGGTFVRADVYEAQRQADLAKIELARAGVAALEVWKTWLARVIVGGISAQIIAGAVLFLLLKGSPS